ncbi:MAG: CBS domain containing-hemolysin-like protein [Parasphingorhabdus sp.]|jgi:CBS domain containing-hemolysin-like protein
MKLMIKTWEVDGLVSLADLERATSLEVSDELEAYTLSGLFIRRLSMMAETGDEILENGFQLQIINHNGRRVGKVRIVRIEDAPDPHEEASG